MHLRNRLVLESLGHPDVAPLNRQNGSRGVALVGLDSILSKHYADCPGTKRYTQTIQWSRTVEYLSSFIGATIGSIDQFDQFDLSCSTYAIYCTWSAPGPAGHVSPCYEVLGTLAPGKFSRLSLIHLFETAEPVRQCHGTRLSATYSVHDWSTPGYLVEQGRSFPGSPSPETALWWLGSLKLGLEWSHSSGCGR